METEIVQGDKSPEELAAQVLSFFGHVLASLAVLALLVFAVTLSGAQSFSSLLMALLAFAVPAVAGYLIHLRLDRSAGPSIWIFGCIWLLIIAMYILQMPTAPGRCEFCGPVDKIWLTLFSPFHDSNLLDGQGRLIGTWPALAMFGYSFGAGLAMRRKSTY